MTRIRRAQNHVRHLLDLIAQFPRANPSAAAAANDGTTPTEPELDIPRLFRQIRSRYKLLCATLGVRPTLRAADGSATAAVGGDGDGSGSGGDDLGVGGAAAGVEITSSPELGATGAAAAGRAARKNVWAVHGARAGAGAGRGAGAELSF